MQISGGFMAALNPFTPTFGKVPSVAAGRDEILADMQYAFENGSGDPILSTILIGPRGVRERGDWAGRRRRKRHGCHCRERRQDHRTRRTCLRRQGNRRLPLHDAACRLPLVGGLQRQFDFP